MKTIIIVIAFSLFTTILRASTMDHIAESYVRLVLAVGQHDGDYVDAFYGPPEWRAAVEKEKKPLSIIAAEAKTAIADLEAMDESSLHGEMLKLRHQYLSRQLSALGSRVEMLQGKKFTFDEESQVLYDAVAPTYSESHFKAIVKKLEALLPGEGTFQVRHEKFRSRFIIPPEKLDAVFKAAIEECRRRTKLHIPLPANESFTVEYVKNKAWSGYNWYKGNNTSLIQVNTDLPIYIDRAIDLAAHEGYPGHHVYNVLLEGHLMKKLGWVEFSVYPLFSPQSLIAEGSANYGVQVVLPDEDRAQFEQNVLFPLAGLDGRERKKYYEVFELVKDLSYAGNEAARGYLDGTMSKEAAQQWLVDYALMSPERAQQRIKFFEKYRSYVINYNLGQDLVEAYIEARATTPEKRWEEFEKLLSSPRLPSELVK